MDKIIILQGVRVTIKFASDDQFMQWVRPNVELAKKPVADGLISVDGFIDDETRTPIRFDMKPHMKDQFLATFLSLGTKTAFVSSGIPVPIEERDLALSAMLKAGLSILTGQRVSEDIIKERISVCSEPCEYLRRTPSGQYYCGICGCNLSIDGRINLAAMVEKRDASGKVTEGCKHPERSQGKGWKR